jgi:predicted N-acetyltransferase YhbS
MPQYTIRDAYDNDLQSIARLRSSIKEFTSINDEEYIPLWKYLIKDNPCHIRTALIAVNEKNEVVAHYAIVPFKFLRDETPLLGGFLCQLMIHEAYRQELIFPKMELKFLKEYKKLGYDFVFSLGNRAHVVKAHLSFGFTKLGELPVYAKPYRLSNIAPHIIKIRMLNQIARPFLIVMEKIIRLKRPAVAKGVAVNEISAFDREFDQFFAIVKHHFQYITVRDSVTLNWRFIDSHKNKYRILVARGKDKIVGYSVLRRMNMKQFDVLAIVDILFSPERPDVGKALLNAVHKAAINLNVDMISCMLNSHDPLCPTLQGAGYFKTPETFSLFVHEPKGTNHHFSTDSFNNWHLTWLDNDAV